MNPAAYKYVGDAASNYDSLRVKKPINIEDGKIIEAFLDGCEPGSTVLDVPAGTGRAVASVLRRNLNYIGVDVSADMLNICREKIGENPNARTLQADARSIPLPSHAADNLLSIKFIKWLPTDEMVLATLAEFRRLCKTRALVNVKIASSDESKQGAVAKWIGSLLHPTKRKISKGPPSRSMHAETFESLCATAGWKVASRTENPASNGRVMFYVLE